MMDENMIRRFLGMREDFDYNKPVKQHDVEVADLVPGRIFESTYTNDRDRTYVEAFEVVGWPKLKDEKDPTSWVIPTRAVKGGHERDWFLSDLGIISYESGAWNTRVLVMLTDGAA